MDGRRLQQALRNLVSNAIRYGAPDAPVRVALIGEANEVRLDVTNSGPPLDAPVLDQLFEPLKRGTTTADPLDANSLGLGLFIVREIVTSHGGEVRVHSADDATTFGMRLPRAGEGGRGGVLDTRD